MAMAAATAAMAGLSAASSVMQGMAGRDAAKYQMEQSARAAEYGRIQAAETDTAMRKELEFTMGNIDAVRAAANADPMSPTGAAVSNYVTSNANQERETKVRNRLRQVADDERAVSFYQSSAQKSMIGGLLSGAGALAKGFAGGGK